MDKKFIQRKYLESLKELRDFFIKRKMRVKAGGSPHEIMIGFPRSRTWYHIDTQKWLLTMKTWKIRPSIKVKKK